MKRLFVILGLLAAGCGMAAAQVALPKQDPRTPEAKPAAAAEAKPVVDVPLPRPRPKIQVWSEPRSFLEAAGPDFKTDEVTAAPSECRLRLEKVAELSPLPRLIGPGACGGSDMVHVSFVLVPGKPKVEIRPATVLRCEMAEQLVMWIREEAVPRIEAAGPALKSVETYDDFSCRGRNRVIGARLSEHGKGNAVDLRAFTLVNNTVLTPTDIKASKELREGLRESACARFTTVLGPGSDGYHEEHIHLDMAERRGGYRICQWAVRVPPPPPPPKVPEPAKEPEPPKDPETAAVAAKVPGRGPLIIVVADDKPLPQPAAVAKPVRRRVAPNPLPSWLR